MKISAGQGERPAIAWASAMLFMPGIWISSRIRSGASFSISRSALAPSMAVPTKLILGMRAHNICSRSIASGSSSTISVLSMSDMGLPRQGQIHPKAAAVAPAVADIGVAIKAGHQAVADITQTDAIARFGRRVAIGIILDSQVEKSVIGSGADGERDRFAAAG